MDWILPAAVVNTRPIPIPLCATSADLPLARETLLTVAKKDGRPGVGLDRSGGFVSTPHDSCHV